MGGQPYQLHVIKSKNACGPSQWSSVCSPFTPLVWIRIPLSYVQFCLNRMQWTHIGNQEAIELSTLEGLIHTQMLYLFGGVGFQKEIVLLILGKCSYSPIAFSMVDLSSGLTPSANSASPFLMSPRIVLRSTMMPFASCVKKYIIIDQHNHDHF